MLLSSPDIVYQAQFYLDPNTVSWEKTYLLHSPCVGDWRLLGTLLNSSVIVLQVLEVILPYNWKGYGYIHTPISMPLIWWRMSKRRSYASILKMLAKGMEHTVFPTYFCPATKLGKTH